MKAFPQPIPRIARAALVVPALAVFAVTLMLARAAAPPAAKMLVVNSDASVAKYVEVQDAFKETLGAGRVTEVDFAKVGEAGVRRALAANPSIIYCIGRNAYQTTTKLAKGRPIVMSTVINWEAFKPIPATTRVIANELPAVQQLTLFRQFFPKLQRVGVIYNPAINKQWFAQAVLAGKEVGVEVIGHTVTRNSQVATELGKLAPKVDALWLASDPIVLENEAAVRSYFARADAAKKPVFTYSPAFTELGATLVIAPDMPTIGRQAASVAQDHAGAPAVSTPAGSEVTLNLKRAQQYGLEFNREALDSVNNLIR
jgi:putative tryptophan/tyrosine transport system substrate-binding protein